ncbi:proteasome regulatory particle base subunit, partial [Blyttiomyces sp. JEL0837]
VRNDTSDSVTIDPRLGDVVQRMLQRCYDDGEFKQAIGIGLEALRLDSGDAKELLSYVLESSLTIVQNLDFRNQVLELLVKLYSGLAEPDYISTSQCYLYLNEPTKLATLLQKLIKLDEYHQLLAYQIAFDVEAEATQEFLKNIIFSLPPNPATIAPAPVPAAASTSVPTDGGDAMETDEATPLVQPEPVVATTSTAPAKVLTPEESSLAKVHKILSGELTIQLHLSFLARSNKTDIQILKKTKDALEPRSVVYHQAITVANGYANAGTTSDEFLRLNLEWLAKATNWTKFTATAGLGVIHKGQLELGKALLGPYLPREGVTGSPYSEGGALFALGLIHANHGNRVVEYLTNALKNTQNELYEILKNVLFSDSAVAGEAAGLAMGLVNLGTANGKAVDEMLLYAHETQHEKIIRGLAMGIALVFYGKEEQADGLIEQLCADKDPILRYSGIFTVAMAYSGTGNNKAIKRLLHVAVSDVNDDVRRAAVTSLGFVLFRTPSQVPRIVQLLSESYNPHVRQGATLALGIACAGTALPEALELLEPMTKDTVDFVRQGALIALGMVLIQHNEVSTPKVETGILDAGGRNVTISLMGSAGTPDMSGVVGLAIFSQFWYWYPYTHFLSLAFNPTGMIGLDKNLDVPKFEFLSNARPSLFAYPPPLKPPETKEVEKVATAVLSTTVRAMARAKKAAKDGDTMDLDKEPSSAVSTTAPEVPAAGDKKDEKADGAAGTPAAAEPKKKKKEPSFEVLENMARVVPAQWKFVKFRESSRYVPVKKTLTGGIVILHDQKPKEPVELMDLTAKRVDEAAATPAAGAPATDATASMVTSP